MFSGEVVEQRFEEILFRADAVVARQVVGHNIRDVGFIKGNVVAVFGYQGLHFLAFLGGQDLPVLIQEVVNLFPSPEHPFDIDVRNENSLLLCLDLIDDVLRPVEVDLLALQIVSYFPPVPPLQETLDQQRVVPFSNVDLVPHHARNIVVLVQFKGNIDVVRKIDLEEEIEEIF